MIRQLTLVLLAFTWCGPPNLEIRQTTAPSFLGGGGTQTVFSNSWSGPQSYGYSSSELQSVPILGLKDAAGTATMSVRWAPNNLSLQNQAEAHVFARDPNERWQTLSQLDNDDAGWQRENDRSHSPWTDVLVSPDGRGNAENISTILQVDLFGTSPPRDETAPPGEIGRAHV